MTFSHLDAGTPEGHWQAAGVSGVREAPGRGRLAAGTLLVVVAAHPDDETLGATGLIRSVLNAGGSVRVVMASLGERSHPDSPTHAPEQLIAVRRAELASALEALGTGHRDRIELVELGLPDGDVAAHTVRVRAAVVDLLDGHAGPAMLATHYRADGHADHDALGHAVSALAADRGLDLYEFPIWFWHWADPSRDPDWRDWVRWPLGAEDRAARLDALAAHASQVEPLSPAPGDEAILGPGMLEHFVGRSFDVYRHTAPEDAAGAGPSSASSASSASSPSARATEVFDRLYREREDPWGYRSSWYERRKRLVTLAALPRERYGTVLEAGSSIGVLTGDLAERAERVIGLEASGVAIREARRALAGRSGVTFEQVVLPDQWPNRLPGGGPADLVVLSEIGYFLSAPELERLLDHLERSLALSGHLVSCHWRQEVEGWPLDGDEVHERVAADPRFRLVSRHLEQDFVVDVLTRASAADRVAVVVPARNEEDLLPGCLQALARAADRWEEVHAQGSVQVVVALDDCTDATAHRAEAVVAGDPRFHVMDLADEAFPAGASASGPSNVGRARDLGLRRAVERLSRSGGAQRTWVASTDADTVVPPDWLVAQTVLAAREDGPVVVAGTVGLDPSGVDPQVLRRWLRDYTHGEDHGHVHAANLGLSWEAYERLGGFPHTAEHEDVALVEAARAAGVPVLSTDRIRAVTSGRTTGRTAGGFAGYLRGLVTDGG
ncbi:MULTISPECIES: PIG-L family deacetylase [Citricoccus]|uniref:PIG-L family deacetylase n=1 Tax=Citricoccus TaxID=169133 RepID=UPI000255F722|nr:PIG-L family deacetylase [Citricoccus sp. CH26A]